MTGLHTLPRPTRRYGIVIAGLVLAIVLALVGGWRLFATQARPAFPTPRLSGAPALEQAYGVRVALIGLIADGAMLDFRLQVIDGDKAFNMMADPNIVPLLQSESSNQLAHIINIMQPRHNMKPGQVFSLLFYNTHGAIKRGDQVTVTIGDVKVEHQAVQ